MKTIQQVQTILKFTFGLVPIVAGLDKFTNLLVNWPDYLGNNAMFIPFSALLFMKIVGVIEIVAGVIVLVRPAIGGYIVSLWLVLIAVSLLISGQHFDVAVRDLVMSIGAYSLAQLTKVVSEKSSI
jgi:hypothetical protein